MLGISEGKLGLFNIFFFFKQKTAYEMLRSLVGSVTASSLGRQSRLGCVGTLREVKRRPGKRADRNGCGARKGAWQPAGSIRARRAPAVDAGRGRQRTAPRSVGAPPQRPTFLSPRTPRKSRRRPAGAP